MTNVRKGYLDNMAMGMHLELCGQSQWLQMDDDYIPVAYWKLRRFADAYFQTRSYEIADLYDRACKSTDSLICKG